MQFVQPQTVDEVLEWQSRLGPNSKLMAGGQSLLAMMRQKVIEPEAIISLKHVKDLHRVALQEDGSLFIGSMLTHHQIATHPLIGRHAPLLAETARKVASVQIRNLGTWGGNIAHGEPGADPPAALMVSSAQVELMGEGGRSRLVAIKDFFLDYLTTDIREGELITGFIIPPTPPGTFSAYDKYTLRDDGDLAIVGMAMRLQMTPAHQIADLEIALSGVSVVPIQIPRISERVLGQTLTDPVIKDIAEYVKNACDPLSDVEVSSEYRRWVIEALITKQLSSFSEASSL
ncbi:carbon-monoxide dehydrogenase medium subunit [Sulfobacillus thermosulfidooxidans DSM 9293]|uniref:Carbon-monoxide dehydrogenase medium subunit n=1 Tax=Sulfobacillus thermosulfidooxidans (strain DSM 9293 / VKM B-1269 / AT-1) TaxID=929705 RepID=A0A1W1WBN9_SULTA|nr:xanthine dehydrogenase family protein subunit M [Sulfobacillus thermosulfidooxidans]SMC03706.1 carbon-monoxide dehydrogenase medium subunit [Sulfobacillus thermosulfidooxidans DSM 9293]